MAPQLVPEQLTVASDMKFLVPGLGSCCMMIHLIALLAIAMLLGLNYTRALRTQPRGLFTLLCIWENLNACMALTMTEHTIDSFSFLNYCH